MLPSMFLTAPPLEHPHRTFLMVLNTETLLQIGFSLAEQFAAVGFRSLEVKGGGDSLFVALAWCEATGRVE